MTLTHLTPADYVTTQWSGGATTQLAIAPKGAVYADRDFLWRLSSATVELDESDFTPLPAYDRVISTLRGDMVLAHNGGERLTLHPYEIHDFSGADDTHSWGRCTDFNLMLRRGQCRGCVTAPFPHGTETLALHAGETALLFCGEGSVTLRAGTETLTLAAHDVSRHIVDSVSWLKPNTRATKISSAAAKMTAIDAGSARLSTFVRNDPFTRALLGSRPNTKPGAPMQKKLMSVI